MALKEEPYRLLVEHVYTVKKCVNNLKSLGEVYSKGDFKTAKELAKKMSELEDEADNIRKEAVSKIPKSIFMPISKHNILLLLRGLDKMAHNIEYGTTLLIARDSPMSDTMAKKFLNHLNFVVGSVEALDEAVLGVYKMLKGERGKKDTAEIIAKVQEVIQNERRADEIHTEIIRYLYGCEGKKESLAIIHLLRAIEHIDKIANLAERTGIRLVSIIGD